MNDLSLSLHLFRHHLPYHLPTIQLLTPTTIIPPTPLTDSLNHLLTYSFTHSLTQTQCSTLLFLALHTFFLNINALIHTLLISSSPPHFVHFSYIQNILIDFTAIKNIHCLFNNTPIKLIFIVFWIKVRARNEFLWSEWSEPFVLERYPNIHLNCTGMPLLH